jgi:hypothetical protein
VRQSRRMSLVESISNVVIGYVLAVATQVVVFPLFGIHVALSDDLAIGGIFAGISLLRAFVLRRAFDALR